jgi:hypothetical protein
MQRTPLELAVDLDRLAGISRRDLKRADPSVHEAVERARQVPVGSTRDVAEKLARHAVLLRLFGRHHGAQEAAQLAVRLYETLDGSGTDAQDRGYEAYARLVCAITWFHAGDRGRAHTMALAAVELFKAHLPSLSPTNMFDLVTLLVVLAQTHRERGEMDQGGQAIVDAKALADALKELPWGPPGSIPPQLWGLPVNPGENERRVVFGSGR